MIWHPITPTTPNTSEMTACPFSGSLVDATVAPGDIGSDMGTPGGRAMVNRTLTAVPGIEVGQWTHESGTTGVTAVLFPAGARGGVWVPGSATGSREMGVLAPGHLSGRVHGFCLSGGSAFGLGAADGVMEVLLARGIGFATPH